MKTVRLPHSKNKFNFLWFLFVYENVYNTRYIETLCRVPFEYIVLKSRSVQRSFRKSVNVENPSGSHAPCSTQQAPPLCRCLAHINQPLILCKPKPLTAGRCLSENMIVLREFCRSVAAFWNLILFWTPGILIRSLHLNLNINWHVPAFANNQDTLVGKKGSKAWKSKLPGRRKRNNGVHVYEWLFWTHSLGAAKGTGGWKELWTTAVIFLHMAVA